jgi:glutathione S-transferase
MADPVVYGPAYSTYARSVLLALEEKGVAYRLEEVDIFSGGAKTPEHLARQPFAKVPAFEHDGFRLYETCAIMRYVDEAFDGPSLQPADAKGRARMEQAISVIDSYAYPSLISGLVIQRMVTPMLGGECDEAVVTEALPQAATSVEALAGILGDDAYLAGDTMSLADLHAVPIFAYASNVPESAEMIAAQPAMARWWQTMSARDSVVKTEPSLG